MLRQHMRLEFRPRIVGLVVVASAALLSACGGSVPAPTAPVVAIPTVTPDTDSTPSDTGIVVPSATPVPVAPGQINADNVALTIEQQFPDQAGGATAQVTCSRSGAFPSVPGDQFTCSYTDDTGRSGTITVTVGAGAGEYTWQVGTPGPTTAGSPTATPA